MGKLVLEIPDDVRDSLRLPFDDLEAELCKELAVALYQRKILSFGKARKLAGMTRWEFEELLGRRKIVRHYSDEDLREDFRHAESESVIPRS